MPVAGPRRNASTEAGNYGVEGSGKRLAIVRQPDGESSNILFHIAGEIDLDTVAGLRDQLARVLDAGATSLKLDVTGITFCGACGIGLCIEMAEACARAGGTLTLHGCSPHLRRCLDILGVTNLCQCSDPLVVD